MYFCQLCCDIAVSISLGLKITPLLLQRQRVITIVVLHSWQSFFLHPELLHLHLSLFRICSQLSRCGERRRLMQAWTALIFLCLFDMALAFWSFSTLVELARPCIESWVD